VAKGKKNVICGFSDDSETRHAQVLCKLLAEEADKRLLQAIGV